jgi:hypothetical protein
MIKVNRKHNLVKLSVLAALDLKHGQLYDARGICSLTGLRHSTVHSHLKFWSDGMLDKNGRCVGLLKRIPAVSGRRLAWKYTISGYGRTWLKAVDPVLLADIRKHLCLRWYQRLLTYDLPGIEPLDSLTSILKENKSIDQVIRSNGESPSEDTSYQDGDSLIIQSSIPTNADSDPDDEELPEAIIQQVKDAWWAGNPYALEGVTFDEIILNYNNDRPSYTDRIGVPQKKLLVLAQRAWELQLQRKRESESNKTVAERGANSFSEHTDSIVENSTVDLPAPAVFNALAPKLIKSIPEVKTDIETIKVETIPDDVALEKWKAICKKHGWRIDDEGNRI